MMSQVVNGLVASCECGKRYRVASKHAGKKTSCPACNHAFEVPSQGSDSGVAEDCSWVDRAANRGWDEEVHGTSKPRPEKEPSVKEPAIVPSVDSWWQDPRFRITAIVCTVLVLIVSGLQTGMDGPTFLNVYLVIGVAVAGLLLVFRATSMPIAVFLAVVVAYELIGLARYGYGVSQGMHRFGTLFSMMLYGPIGFLVLSVSSFEGGGSSSSWGSSGCSSGSSCGGGGCGGGGCGGCGG